MPDDAQLPPGDRDQERTNLRHADDCCFSLRRGRQWLVIVEDQDGDTTMYTHLTRASELPGILGKLTGHVTQVMVEQRLAAWASGDEDGLVEGL